MTDEPVTVYNFQVEDYHTYHVCTLGVLVHNASRKYSSTKEFNEAISKMDSNERVATVKQEARAVAVISTIGSSILNVIDTWCDIDSSTFKTLKNVFNWTSVISNGVYSIGTIYNGFKGISNAAIKEMNGNRLVNVTRWGRTGLQSGDWVMKGGNTWGNYILSGKWDPFSWNQFAAKNTGQTYQVLLKTLKRPSGRGIDGLLKIIVNQWKFIP